MAHRLNYGIQLSIFSEGIEGPCGKDGSSVTSNKSNKNVNTFGAAHVVKFLVNTCEEMNNLSNYFIGCLLQQHFVTSRLLYNQQYNKYIPQSAGEFICNRSNEKFLDQCAKYQSSSRCRALIRVLDTRKEPVDLQMFFHSTLDLDVFLLLIGISKTAIDVSASLRQTVTNEWVEYITSSLIRRDYCDKLKTLDPKLLDGFVNSIDEDGNVSRGYLERLLSRA